MSTILDQRIAERDQAIGAARALAESEDFNPEDPTYLDLRTRATELDAQIGSYAALLDQQAASDQFDGRMAKQRQQHQQDRSPVTTRESWGETWIRSEEAQSYRMKGSSGVVTIEDDGVQTRALPTGIADLVAAGLTGTKTTVDITPPVQPTPMLDAVTNVQVSGNALETVVWQKKAGGAATVAEKAAKPSVEYGPTVVPDTLEMIAVYTQLTRQLMEDAPAVRSLIDGELRREIAREEEEHAVAAVGAATLPTASSDDLVSAIRVGVATVQSAGYSPTAVMLHPNDYAAMDIAVMGATLLGPTIRQSFWGMVPIPAATQAEGTAIVGDFATAIQRFYRSQIQLFVTDSHADTFLSNVFTLLAERRSKTLVVKPQALVEVSAA